MKQYDVIIIGGSAAGISAAVSARRHYPNKSICLIRQEKQVLVPCGIPYIFGTLDTSMDNVIPDGLFNKNNIDLVVDEATSVDRKDRQITTKSGETFSYDRLVMATGSKPLKPPIPGIEKENVFFAEKDIAYLDNMLTRLDGFKNIVVLGGGFIGVEFADELRKHNINVKIVEMLPHCLMHAFEKEFCLEAEDLLKKTKIDLVTNAKLVEIQGDKNVTGVRLADGQMLDADAVLIGIGVRPNTRLAEAAGLEINRNGIIVDNYLRTSDEHIFACGDCTDKKSFFTGTTSELKLASIATMEARVSGANLFEPRRRQDGVIGVFSTSIGNTVFAVAGLGEKQAQNLGFETCSGVVEMPNRHPNKMPGMTLTKVKLVFNRANGEILGGTARGGDSVGELINTISACIQKRMTADDIATFQLGTHPAVTASPIAYQLVNAAELAIQQQTSSTN